MKRKQIIEGILTSTFLFIMEKKIVLSSLSLNEVIDDQKKMREKNEKEKRRRNRKDCQRKRVQKE